MKEAPDGLEIIVVNWNTAGWVLYLVEQLRGCPGWARILVIDNGSHPNEQRALRQFLPPSCELVPLGMNVGVAGAWNEGWLRATAPVVALLNVDLRIHRPDCLTRAREMFDQDEHLGVLSIADNEPPAWFRGGRITGGALAKPGQAVDCDGVTGAAYLFRRELGPFDETFSPAYCEETDHCLRARARGYRVVQCGLGVEHLSGGTMRSRFEEPSREGIFQLQQQRLARKWQDRWPPVDQRQAGGSG